MAKGFYTDTTVCIGCKACQVACHQWNQLPAEEGGRRELTGDSYDNTGRLSAVNWRHVRFVEQFPEDRAQQGFLQGSRWLMMSDVCKHCVRAACLEVCPTGAIIRTEFDSVYIQPEVCNGCRACITACPFGVPDIGEDGKAHKCTLCYDRLQHGMEPACAQACPTDSIRFGDVGELMGLADQRVAALRAQGIDAYVYGKEDIVGGLNCFYVLVDRPEVYGLPANPQVGSANVPEGFAFSALGAAALAVTGLLSFRKERMAGGDGGSGMRDGETTPDDPAPPTRPPEPDERAPRSLFDAVHLANEAAARQRRRRSLPILGQPRPTA
jgi:formate dehydrogenase iron-sulfur subunit